MHKSRGLQGSSGKRAVVTGAARGIGLAIALGLSAAGATVIGTDSSRGGGLAALEPGPGLGERDN